MSTLWEENPAAVADGPTLERENDGKMRAMHQAVSYGVENKKGLLRSSKCIDIH